MIETMGTAKRPGGARGSVLLAALLLGISAACAAAGLSLPPGDPGRAPDLAGMRDPIPRPRSLDGPSDGARGTLLGKTMEPLASQEEERSREEARASLGEPEEDRAARISPVVAFLMSAALPGSGQLVEGRNRAFAYLGVEVLSWVSHFAWKDAALRKEGEYEAYADRHWDLEAWSDAALEDCPAGAIPPGGNYAELYETIQRLRVEDTNDYYELLAKEDGYRAGWDDFSCPSPEGLSPNRREYRAMREDSNTFLKRARLATTVVFLNRIVSAVDAYRTARGARVSVGAGTNLEIRFGGSLTNPRASLKMVRHL